MSRTDILKSMQIGCIVLMFSIVTIELFAFFIIFYYYLLSYSMHAYCSCFEECGREIKV